MSNSNRRWKIDPNMTAMENLYDACRVATSVVLSRHSITIYKHEEFEELFEELLLAGMSHFMRIKIGQRTYDRRFTFFQNCYSSVWACLSGTLYKWTHSIDRKIRTSSIDNCSVGDISLITCLADLHNRPDEAMLEAEEPPRVVPDNQLPPEKLKRRQYARKYRDRQRAKAAALRQSRPQDPGPSPRRCRDRDK
jgi:hypothetical protein